MLQTVPSSPNLYKNSFTYETVEEVPPDFASCNKFIGAALLTLALHRINSPCDAVATIASYRCHEIKLLTQCLDMSVVLCSFADMARAAQTRILVHCMSGVTR